MAKTISKADSTGTETKSRSLWADVISRLVRNKMAMVGLFILVLITLLCIFAGVVFPQGYDVQDVYNKFQPPSWEHICGTDSLGRDMLVRLLYGGRMSLLVAIVSTAISATIGIILGSFAGFYGGKIDNLIMRFLDIFNSIPNLLMAIAISAALGPGIGNCMLAVGISAVPGFARTVRGPILAVKEQEYVEAARSINASDWRIIFHHVLPNVLSPIIVQVTMNFASSILVAASLSFLGLGVQPPTPEWGAMLSQARQHIRQYPYLVTFPGLAIAAVVLSTNLFGDGLRDALDPRLKN